MNGLAGRLNGFRRNLTKQSVRPEPDRTLGLCEPVQSEPLQAFLLELSTIHEGSGDPRDRRDPSKETGEGVGVRSDIHPPPPFGAEDLLVPKDCAISQQEEKSGPVECDPISV